MMYVLLHQYLKAYPGSRGCQPIRGTTAPLAKRPVQTVIMLPNGRGCAIGESLGNRYRLGALGTEGGFGVASICPVAAAAGAAGVHLRETFPGKKQRSLRIQHCHRSAGAASGLRSGAGRDLAG